MIDLRLAAQHVEFLYNFLSVKYWCRANLYPLSQAVRVIAVEAEGVSNHELGITERTTTILNI
jgi:hypothetical protein